MRHSIRIWKFWIKDFQIAELQDLILAEKRPKLEGAKKGPSRIMIKLAKSKRGKIMTCQDDLIEFREAMQNLKKEKGRNEWQAETEKLKAVTELIRSWQAVPDRPVAFERIPRWYINPEVEVPVGRRKVVLLIK